MKIDIESIFKTLGLPAGLVIVLAAVLSLFGVSFDKVIGIASSMLGLWATISLVINILKVFKVVDAGTSGKWSAALNLIGVLGVAAVLATDPVFDFSALNSQLQIIAQFGALVLTFVVNMIGTQAMHKVQVKTLHIRSFTFADQLPF
jgi:hypothetical protein